METGTVVTEEAVGVLAAETGMETVMANGVTVVAATVVVVSMAVACWVEWEVETVAGAMEEEVLGEALVAEWEVGMPEAAAMAVAA